MPLLPEILSKLLYAYNTRRWRRRLQRIKFMGEEFILLPEVFDPRGVISTELLAKVLPLQGEILEVGCGSGVLTCLAARTASRVLAFDVNPIAAKNALMNTRLHNLQGKVDVLTADASSLEVKRLFDVALVNPPYLPLRPRNLVEAAWCAGEKLELLESMLRFSYRHLKSGGRIYVVLSSLAGRRAEELLAELFHSIEVKERRATPFDVIMLFQGVKP